MRWQKMFAEWNHRRETQRVEAQLDGFLQLVELELQVQPKLDRVLEELIPILHPPMRGKIEQVLHRYRVQGMHLEESLRVMGEATPGKELARAIILLVHLAQHGLTPYGLQGVQQMQKDLQLQHQFRLRAYASTLTLLSLVFIGVSALVPAMFLAFVSIGSSFLELSLSAGDIVLIALVGFPLLDALVLGILWLKTPAIARV